VSLSRVLRKIQIILLVVSILCLLGCHDLRLNWADNRTRIKPKLVLDKKFRESEQYRELFELVIRKYVARRYEEQQRMYAQDPNQPYSPYATDSKALVMKVKH
jgi:hypothetical protein